MKKTAETVIAGILRGAASKVRQGWCQHVVADGYGNVCAVGAIQDAAHEALGLLPAVAFELRIRGALVRALNLVPPPDSVCPIPVCPIPAWNDGAGQTAENVALGLEYAALMCEQQADSPIGSATKGVS